MIRLHAATDMSAFTFFVISQQTLAVYRWCNKGSNLRMLKSFATTECFQNLRTVVINSVLRFSALTEKFEIADVPKQL